jgi:hypothetical protein
MQMHNPWTGWRHQGKLVGQRVGQRLRVGPVARWHDVGIASLDELGETKVQGVWQHCAGSAQRDQQAALRSVLDHAGDERS